MNNPGYEPADLPATLLCVSGLGYISYVFFSTGANVVKRTVVHSVAFGFAFLIALTGCAFFTPPYGAVGASFSILLAILTLSLVTYNLSQRVHRVPYAIRTICYGLAITVVVGIFMNASGFFDGAAGVLAKNVVAAITTMALFKLMLSFEARLKLVRQFKSLIDVKQVR